MAEILGLDCVLTAGGTEVPMLTDVKLEIKAEEIDTTSRGAASAAKWKGKRTGLLEWSWSSDMIRSQADASYGTLRDAVIARTAVACVFSEPAGTGSETWTGSCYISDFSRSEPLGDVVKISIKAIGNGALVPASI
jgi:hypothetical protein